MAGAFVFAADRGYEVPLAVAMSSLVEQTPNETVIVLDGGLLPAAKHSIESFLHDRAEIRWLQVDDTRLEGTAVAGPNRLPVAANFRILLPELAPELERAVYLDSDTVVAASLGRLLEVDLGEAWLGAVPDAGSPMAAGSAGPDWQQLGLDPGSLYFNSGMMVIPLATWREVGLPARALAVLHEKAPRWGDQDALNVASEGHWMALPRRYNMQLGDVTGYSLAWALWREETAAAVADPALVHFNGHIKPWQAGCPHPLRHLWWEALGRTPWRDWQMPTQSRAGRLMGKLAKGIRREFS